MRVFWASCFMIILFLFPDGASDCARHALVLWGRDVMPSLFPYMVLVRMISAGPAGDKRSCILPAVLGLIGGSPSGAAALSASSLEKLQKNRLLALCALTGGISPMFLYHTAGAWFGDAVFGRCLLLSCMSGAVIAAFLLHRLSSSQAACAYTVCSREISSPISDSVQAILGVGGCIVFYSVIAFALSKVIPLSPFSSAALHSVIEVSGGVRAMAELSLPAALQGIWVAFFCGFSGISILSQNLMFLQSMGIRMRQLMAIGILRGILSAACMAFLLPLFCAQR